jgi:hypothetical protein
MMLRVQSIQRRDPCQMKPLEKRMLIGSVRSGRFSARINEAITIAVPSYIKTSIPCKTRQPLFKRDTGETLGRQ